MRKLAKDEIDLSKIIIIVFSNKLKIFLITLITVIVGFSLNQLKLQNASKTFLIKAQIHPIAVFEMSRYQEYNAYISNMFQNETERTSNILLKSKIDGETYRYYKSDFFDKIVNQNIQKSNLDKIDNMYLYSLFIAIINEEERIIQLIKEFNIIKKEKYQDNELYEKIVKKLASSIKVTDYEFLKEENKNNLLLNFSNIQLKVENKQVGMKFLNLIQENINKDIKNHLKNEFNNLVISSNKLKVYRIEDIEFEISNNLEETNIVTQLKKLKKRIERNKDIERLKNIFQRTPIFSDKFFAAKFKAKSYMLLNHQKYDNFPNFFKFVLLGLLLGIIYIMLENIIKKPMKNFKS
jgi:hypothetical protein